MRYVLLAFLTTCSDCCPVRTPRGALANRHWRQCPRAQGGLFNHAVGTGTYDVNVLVAGRGATGTPAFRAPPPRQASAQVQA